MAQEEPQVQPQGTEQGADVQCIFCGNVRTHSQASDNGWAFDVYYGNIDQGPACPDCVERYCDANTFENPDILEEGVRFLNHGRRQWLVTLPMIVWGESIDEARRTVQRMIADRTLEVEVELYKGYRD